MVKTWYPVIDYALCDSCGSCVQFRRHAVYDPDKTPVPVVRNPGGCVNHCHGCGNRCPAGAIRYVGTTPAGSHPRQRCFPGRVVALPNQEMA